MKRKNSPRRRTKLQTTGGCAERSIQPIQPMDDPVRLRDALWVACRLLVKGKDACPEKAARALYETASELIAGLYLRPGGEVVPIGLAENTEV